MKPRYIFLTYTAVLFLNLLKSTRPNFVSLVSILDPELSIPLADLDTCQDIHYISLLDKQVVYLISCYPAKQRHFVQPISERDRHTPPLHTRYRSASDKEP